MLDEKNIWEQDINELISNNYNLQPLWTVDFSSEDEILKWHSSVIDPLKDIHRDFTERCFINLMLLKGITDFEDFDISRLDRDYRTKTPQISVNLVYELTDIWVNRMSQYKARISVLPKNNDSSARQDAKMKQMAIDDSFARNNIDFLLQKFQLFTRSMGEAYIVINWNPDLGAVHPDVIKAKSKGKKIYVTAPDGTEVPLEREARIGDVEYQLYEPYRVLFPLVEWDKTDYYCTIDYVEPAKLATDYPDKTIEDKGKKLINGQIEVFTYYHPPTKYLPEGRYVKLIAGCVLVNTPYPYSFKGKNAVRLTDIDIPNQVRGKSFIENIATQQLLTNMVMGANWRNISVSSHAKWVAPRNSINYKSLSNQGNVIEYAGSTPPSLVKYNGLSAESFNFLDMLRRQAESQARLQGITLGTPPPNIRSGLQIAQLEEQQQRAVTFDITKRNMAIEQIANIALAIMADYYDESDGRLLRIVGKDKGHLVRALKVSSLQGEHTIEIKNNNSLPEGKYEKLSMLIDMKNAFPNLVPDEIVVDSFELGQISRYSDYATAAVEKAESENEEMLDGSPPPVPESYDDHISEWKIHVSALRRRSFADASAEVKALFEEHIGVHEMLMEEKAKTNPMFLQELQMLKDYPVFYTLTETANLPEDAVATSEQAQAESLGIPLTQEVSEVAEEDAELPI